MPGDYPALHRLENTLQPLTANLAGPFYMTVIGTVNTVGGGTGGTSSTDESAFTTGATSLTPIGALALPIGATALASMNTGLIGAPKMSPQRILFTSIATPSGGDAMDNTNAALRVNVVAGGAGGGVANITVRGTANTDLKVGYASGANPAWPNADGAAWLPVFFPSGFYPTVNAAIANAGIFGSVSVVGSVNVQGSLGVGQIGSPWGVAGSLYATVNLAGGFATVWYGGIGADTVNSAVRVNVVAGGAGGGVANITMRGTGNTDYHTGYASQNLGAWPNYDGAAWTPVFFPSGFYPTVNAAIANAGIFGSVQVVGSVNITGSLNPVGIFGSLNTNPLITGTGNTAYRLGYASQNLGAWPNYDGAAWMPVMFPSGFYPTVNTSGGGFATVGVYGSIASGSMNVLAGQAGAPWTVTGSMNVAGSLGVGQLAGPWTVTGSVNVQGSLGVGQIGAPWGVAGSLYASVNLGGVGVVDVRGSLAPTQWIISTPASGQFQVAGSAPAAMRDYLTSFHLISTGTVDFQWQSPSGVAISGSMRLLPGAGFALGGVLGAGPNLIGAVQGGIYILTAGTQNVGGMAVGWVGA